MKSLVLIITLFVAPMVAASAAPDTEPLRGGGRRGPPPEAIAACKDKSAGDACSFTGRRGAEKGTCRQPPRHSSLVCVPNNHRPPPRR